MNRMCKDCLCLNVDCVGTNNTNWTGCIFKKTAEMTADHEQRKAQANDVKCEHCGSDMKEGFLCPECGK